MYHKAKEMLQKIVNPSMEDIHPYLRDGTKTINTQIISLIGWPEEHMIEHDKIALGSLIRRKKS